MAEIITPPGFFSATLFILVLACIALIANEVRKSVFFNLSPLTLMTNARGEARCHTMNEYIVACWGNFPSPPFFFSFPRDEAEIHPPHSKPSSHCCLLSHLLQRQAHDCALRRAKTCPEERLFAES